VDMSPAAARVLERSRFNRIQGIDWSPDGRWIAYGFPQTAQTCCIKLYQLESGEIWPISRPVQRDVQPAFDPEGRYLYFIGYRTFDPVQDNMQFDFGFPRGTRPYAITLRRDLRSPFVAEPKALPGKEEAALEALEARSEERPESLRIDLDGIERRLVPFPVPEGRYSRVQGTRRKVLFSSFPIEGTRDLDWTVVLPEARGDLEVYDLEDQKRDTVVSGISDFVIGPDHRTLIYRAGNRLRVLVAGETPPQAEKEAPDQPGRESGWLDLGRVRISVLPAADWAHMYREAWRLQRDHFWTPDMSQVRWDEIYARYAPLLERVNSRAELSDLLWELQGELGTSHAYEFGGEYRQGPQYPQGFLGADWTYDAASGHYRIARLVTGDPSNLETTSSLLAPGINVQPGARLLAINGQTVGPTRGPWELLVHQADTEVQLTLADGEGNNPRSVTVHTLKSERPARYREWVDRQQQLVHQATDGRVGYVHIPDMGPEGFAEFHRTYLTEYDREALIIDVRNNGGGEVSSLLLEKLARRRSAYIFQRWSAPMPYPPESPRGPLVALTDEQAGSDGDIFSHIFKLMGLGPLIGKRTWGGVIGITVNHTLIDGTLTTQPEFAFWFTDVGWQVENYGTDPDIDVDFAPQDYMAHRDPQLERAIGEALARLEAQPSPTPEPQEPPSRAAPPLPPRASISS
ncbi:MAG TPA: S41 family peptidase, partial [Chloroflexota bacterium]|nr:S41 family peptidase [Chloroflexota bacterium]